MNRSPRFAALRSQAEIDAEDRRARRDALSIAIANLAVYGAIGFVLYMMGKVFWYAHIWEVPLRPLLNQ